MLTLNSGPFVVNRGTVTESSETFFHISPSCSPGWEFGTRKVVDLQSLPSSSSFRRTPRGQSLSLPFEFSCDTVLRSLSYLRLRQLVQLTMTFQFILLFLFTRRKNLKLCSSSDHWNCFHQNVLTPVSDQTTLTFSFTLHFFVSFAHILYSSCSNKS